MGRENKTRYAILGMLATCSMSGYDIKKAIEKGLGEFWNESNGQIYPIIKQLAADGLATRVVERHEGKPDRHVYTITENGMDELREWLVKPAEPSKYRIELLLKLFFGSEMSPAENLKHIEMFEREQSAVLERYEAINMRLLTEHACDPEIQYRRMTLRCGMHVINGFLDWCEEAKSMVAKMQSAG